MKSSNATANAQRKTAYRSVGKRIVYRIKDLAKRQQTGCHNDSSGGTHNDNQVVGCSTGPDT